MRKRAVKWLAAIFAGTVTACTITAIPEASAEPKDCLTTPDGQAGQGGHWFYRIDPATNRRCWYHRGDGQQAMQTAFSSIGPSGALSDPPLQRSVADARAELAAAPEALTSKAGDRSAILTVASTASDDTDTASEPAFSAQSNILTDRGSDNSDTMAPTDVTPSSVFAGVRHRPRSVSAKHIGHHHPPRSVWMLLGALAGALALVGIATTMFSKLGGAIGRQRRRGRKRVIWSTEPADITFPVEPSDETPLDWIRTARESQEINRQGEQIEQLLASFSRRSAV